MTHDVRFHSRSTGHRLHTCLVLAFAAAVCSLSADAPTCQDSTEDSLLPLPRWTDSEIQTFHNSSGAALLPGMGPTMTDLTGLKPETGPRLEELFKEAPDLPSRLKPEEMRLFLPTALLGQATTRHVEHDSSPTPIAALQDVTPEFMALCEQAPPGEFLIDPELLLPEMQAQAMRQFLEFHAKDARIHLSVLVLPKNRKLWGEPTLEHIASGSLMGGDSCLVAYPLSEPWRAQMFLSERVHRKASDAFLRETLQACVNSAVQTSDTHDQMHRYMVELSTRLFWLQKALAPASNGINANQLLAQVSTEERNIATSSDSSAFLWKTLCIASTLIILVIHRLRVKRRLGNHAKYVWHFPEPETIPRLGGAFTGGGGGMIRY